MHTCLKNHLQYIALENHVFISNVHPILQCNFNFYHYKHAIYSISWKSEPIFHVR